MIGLPKSRDISPFAELKSSCLKGAQNLTKIHLLPLSEPFIWMKCSIIISAELLLCPTLLLGTRVAKWLKASKYFLSGMDWPRFKSCQSKNQLIIVNFCFALTQPLSLNLRPYMMRPKYLAQHEQGKKRHKKSLKMISNTNLLNYRLHRSQGGLSFVILILDSPSLESS